METLSILDMWPSYQVGGFSMGLNSYLPRFQYLLLVCVEVFIYVRFAKAGMLKEQISNKTLGTS